MSEYLSFFLISFIITIFLLVFGIPVLRIIKFGQSIRGEGPKSHFPKAGTPTMGGVAIILSVIATFIFVSVKFKFNKHDILLLIMPLILYSVIGFIDDYLIVVKRNNRGISARNKMFFQIIWAAIYYFVFLDRGMSSEINIFNYTVDLKWGYGILILLMLVSCSNAVNLSDGLDGLASGLMVIALISIVILAIFKGNLPVLVFSICLLGALLGFLCYNFNPAKVFMGNTGSLALGATLANLFILLKMEVLLVVVGFVFVLETLSVIIQVAYFKLTKGKRIFKMAPLHHHYELKGYSEIEVNLIFWIVGVIAGVIGILLGIKVFI